MKKALERVSFESFLIVAILECDRYDGYVKALIVWARDFFKKSAKKIDAEFESK